jgi:hypothetical protein
MVIKEKAPATFKSGRLGSPPPELPNHRMDTKSGLISRKRHFSNPISAKLTL